MCIIYSTTLRKVLLKSRACFGDVAVTGDKHSFCAGEKNGEGTWAKGLIDASSGGAAGGRGPSCLCRWPSWSLGCSRLQVRSPRVLRRVLPGVISSRG